MSEVTVGVFWRKPGVWLSAVLVGYLGFNVLRAVLDPVSFADSFGTPLRDPSETSFVLVYAIRTLFLSLFGLALLVRRRLKDLTWYVLVAVVMPVGDALLVASSGGAPAIIARHVVIAALVLVTGVLLWRSFRGTNR